MAEPEIITWRDATAGRRRVLMERNGTVGQLQGSADLTSGIRDLLDDVRLRGDAALIGALARFDRVETDTCRVTASEMQAAEAQISPELSQAIDLAIDRSIDFNRHIVRRASWTDRTRGGGTIGEIARPVESVGLFVPSGKGSFPSVMVQIGAPAVAAGVRNLYLVVPPLPSGGGRVDPATLVAARRLGVTDVFRLNGPSGIGALAYGTETVPKVRMIVGPGSVPVTLAQQLVQSEGVTVVGGLGPSDSLIVADGSADMRLLAADVINEAEHGPDSSAVLISVDRGLLEKVAIEITAQLAALPEPRRSYAAASIWENGGLVVAENWAQVWQIANDYAPEHVQIATTNPERFLDDVKFAGTALLGQWTTFAASNFVIGTPATLPATGYAKQVSGVTAHTYLNSISMAQIGEQEFWTLADSIKAFCRHEGFPAHEASVTARAEMRSVPAAAESGQPEQAEQGTVLVLRWREDLVRAVRRQGFGVALLYLPSEADAVEFDLVDHAELVDDLVNVERMHGALARLAIPDLVGVLSIDEWSIVSGAYVARQFGVPSIDPDVAVGFRDKFVQKHRLRTAGIRTSRAQLLNDVTASDTPDLVERFGYPAVLKPLAGAGAALTHRIDSAADLTDLVERAGQDSYGRRTYVMEEYQNGEEWHVDGYVKDGELAFFAVSRYDEPLIQVHQGSVVASRCFDPETDDWAYQAAGRLTREALRALRLENSVFHLECFRRADVELVFGECAARSGGSMIVEAVRAKFGVDLIDVAVSLATGRDDTLPEVRLRPGVVGFTFLPSAPGTIETLPTVDELSTRPGVVEARYLSKVGQQAPDMTFWTGARVGEAVLSAPDTPTYDAQLADLLSWFRATAKSAPAGVR